VAVGDERRLPARDERDGARSAIAQQPRNVGSILLLIIIVCDLRVSRVACCSCLSPDSSSALSGPASGARSAGTGNVHAGAIAAIRRPDARAGAHCGPHVHGEAEPRPR
jgi:hypothetical protein